MTKARGVCGSTATLPPPSSLPCDKLLEGKERCLLLLVGGLVTQVGEQRARGVVDERNLNSCKRG